MVNLALRSLIAIALYEAVVPMVASPVAAVAEDLTVATVLATLRLNLKSSRIEYISALPLRLPHGAGRGRAGLISQLSQRLNGGLTCANPAELAIASKLWQQLDMTELPSGQLRLRLRPEGLGLWLQEWILSPAAGLQPVMAAPETLEAIFSAQQPLAQRLQLHPLVAMQYLYCRCDRICQAGFASQLPWGGDPPPHGKIAEPETSILQQFIAMEDAPLWVSLVHLADHLQVPSIAAKRLWLLGYQLATAIDLWLGELPCIRPLSVPQEIVLRGVHQALYRLLALKFGCPLPLNF